MAEKETKKENKRSSIKWQFILFFTTFIIIPFILFALLASYQIVNSNYKNNIIVYQNILNGVSGSFDQMIDRYIVILEQITYMENFKKILLSPLNKSDSGREKFYRQLGEFSRQRGEMNITNTAIWQLDGELFILRPDKKGQLSTDFFGFPSVTLDTIALQADPLYTSLSDNSQRPFVVGILQPGVMKGYDVYSKPVILYPYSSKKNSSTFEALLVVVLSKSIIEHTYSSMSKLTHGTLYILDEYNSVVSTNQPGRSDFFSDSDTTKSYLSSLGTVDPITGMTLSEYQLLNTDPEIFSHNALRMILNKGHYQLISMNRIPGGIDIKWNNIKYLTLIKYASGSRLKFAFIQPVPIINRGINTTFLVIVGFSLLIITTAIIFIFIFSNYYIGPIKRIADAAYKVSKGNYNIQVKYNGNNELSTLTDSFNRMANEIKGTIDILELVVDERTRELKKLNNELEIKNKFKSQYLAHMSHEIRTPLNSILGYNQLFLLNTFNSRDDILEINSEIMEILEKVSDKPVFQEFTKSCELFTSIFNNRKSDIKYFYLHSLQHYLKNITGNKENDSIVEKIQPLVGEIATVLQEEDEFFTKGLSYSSKCGTHLLELINTILDISAIESGKIELDLSDVKSDEFLNQVIETARLYLKNKNKPGEIALSLYIGKNVPNIVVFDKTKINQVLLNLLSNSIKFTNEGEVSLHVECEYKFLKFRVKDTGIGIKKDEMDMLFHEFSRSSTTSEIEGTGLGLVLVKKIINLHFGTISVQSEYKKGSEFIFYIPYEEENYQKKDFL